MSSTVSFPSDTFPAVTPVALETAEGWSPIDVPIAVIALQRSVEPGAFISNIMVVIRRATADATQAEVVEAYVARQQERPGAQVTRSDELTIGGSSFLAHEMSFEVATSATESLRVMQSTVIGLVDRGRVKDLVEVTGTAAAERDHAEIQKMLESLAIG